MKQYQKAQMIAKNLPTGSYAAGCPQGHKVGSNTAVRDNVPSGYRGPVSGQCDVCEIAG